MSTIWAIDPDRIERVVVVNATSAPKTSATVTKILAEVPSNNPLNDGWSWTIEGSDLIITGPERPTGSAGDVQNTISGGTHYGPVIQARNVSGLTFPMSGAPVIQSQDPVVVVTAPPGITFVNNP